MVAYVDAQGLQKFTIHVQLYWDAERNSTLVSVKVLDKAGDAATTDFDERKKMLLAQQKLTSKLFSKAGRAWTRRCRSCTASASQTRNRRL